MSDWIDRLANKLQGHDLAFAMRAALAEHERWSMVLGMQVACPRCGAKDGDWCLPGNAICHAREHVARDLRAAEHPWN